MEEVEDKLNWFQWHCLALAEKEKAELEKTVESEIEQRIKLALDQEDERIERRKQKEFEKEKQRFFEQIWEEEIKGKKKIYETQEAIKKQLIEELTIKLQDFVNSPEYDLYVQASLASVLEEIQGSQKMCFWTLAKDREKWEKWLNEQRKNQEKMCEIKALEEESIGGWIIETENKVIDNTLLTNIKEKVYGTKENYTN